MTSRLGPPLTSPRSERVRAVRALGRSGPRAERGLFLAEGPQAVREALRWRADDVVDLYVDLAAGPRAQEMVELAERAGGRVRVTQVSPAALAAMADTRSPQGVLAVCRRPRAALAQVLATGPRVLAVMANVRDPGNAGTVIRAADASGADAVVVGDASVDVTNPKVVRATAGSLFHLPVVTGEQVLPLIETLRGAGIRVIAADGTAPQQLSETDLSRPHAWLFGNEAWGLTGEVRRACDLTVRIPIHGRAESLNLAMAATVCLYASAEASPGGPV